MSDEACVTTTTTAWSRVARVGRVERAAKGATGRRVWLTLHLSTGSNCVDAAKRCDAMRCDGMRERQRQPHNNNNCRLTSQMERGKRERGSRRGRINNARRYANLAKWLVGHEATGSTAATANATDEKSHPFISGTSNTNSRDSNSRDSDSES